AVRVVKAVARRQRALSGYFEDGAGVVVGPASGRCPVEVAIGGLNQPPGGVDPIRVVKTVQRRQLATWGDFEDRATSGGGAVGPAIERRPVEVPISGLDQPGVGDGAVRAMVLGAKAVKSRQRATRRNFEDRAIAIPELSRCPIEVPIRGLDQPPPG